MNICIHRVLRACAAIIAAIALPVLADDAPAKCKLVRVADWHVRLSGGTHPILDGTVNGTKVGVLIDTGAFASFVTKAAAERLGLTSRGTSQFVVGTGGESRVWIARIDDLKIGDFSAKGLRVRVAGEQPLGGIDFVLGQDFFRTLDMEFDYANGAVRLFQPLDCKDKALSYWDPDALQLPLTGSGKDLITVAINGRKASAQIDSGAGGSVVHLDFAEKLGIGPRSPGVAPSSCSFGVGGDVVREWVAKFDTVQVGGETIHDPRIRIAEWVPDYVYWRGSDTADLLLGADFLKAHRMFLSHSQGKVYLSYTGGLIFPAIPALNCNDERVAGKNAAEALKVYDDALAKDPRDVDALIRRAGLRNAAKDSKGALSDLDAAIAIDPSNAIALSLRSRIRRDMKDYAGALADADSAIARGMRSSQMLVYRASVHRAQGDNEASAADYAGALELDPHNVDALRRAGHFLFGLGRYEAAEAHFRTLLAIRANGFDSLWLYLSRARRGIDEAASLEQGLKSLTGDDWPSPILQYMAGRIDRDALVASAAADEKERRGRECEAHFYTAERLLISGKKDEAKPLLETARDQCPHGYFEYADAVAELEQPR